MGLFKSLLRRVEFIFSFRDFVYLLQLEEYNTSRYISFQKKFFLRRNFQKREELIITKRAGLTILVSTILYVFIAFIVIDTPNNLILSIAILVSVTAGIPFLVGVSNVIVFFGTYPVRSYIKNTARNKLKINDGLIVVAIAGSHGKTTTKYFLEELLKYNYRVKATPGNINTPLGIANWINNDIHDGVQILIAEMDTYWPGEVTDACKILSPQHAILTSLGKQHLERFKNLEELHAALLEVFECSREDGKKIAPAILKETILSAGYSDVQYADDKAMYAGEVIEASQLSETQKKSLALALRMAEEFDVPKNIVVDTCTKLTVPDRRQKVTMVMGFDAIDDSYNISLDTAIAGIERAKSLAKERNKKLIVVTAGIAELGTENAEDNKKLGELLNEHADKIAILKSDFYKQIIDGISNDSNYQLFTDLNEFWSELETLSQEEWVLLQQPELTDLNY